MKKYFYAVGTNSHGPFSLDELREKGITAQTLVWFEGLDGWRKAADLPELNGLFVVPPPHTQTPIGGHSMQYQSPSNPPPKTWLVESILATLFCCLPFGIVGIVNATKVETLFRAGNYADAVKASENAKKWTIISLVLGLVVLGGYLVYFVILAATGDV